MGNPKIRDLMYKHKIMLVSIGPKKEDYYRIMNIIYNWQKVV
jgi:hypothetical protein